MTPSHAAIGECGHLSVAAVCPPKSDPCARIMRALGLRQGPIPRVDDDSLSAYAEFLSTHLEMPFTAWYPAATSAKQRSENRLTVIELLDPRAHLGDPFDGLFVKTRKGKYEVNLPLGELYVPHGSTNFGLIEDYWHWFWNWR